jgi:hypothetical protein
VAASHPYNRLRYLKALFAIKVDADFRFETGIADGIDNKLDFP